MKRETPEPVVILNSATITKVVMLIRTDPVLGSETSSWSEVAPTEWEARDRVRDLVELGKVKVEGKPTARAIVRALKQAEAGFWSTFEPGGWA